MSGIKLKEAPTFGNCLAFSLMSRYSLDLGGEGW